MDYIQVAYGDFVTPDTVIAYTQAGEQDHLHLEIIRGGSRNNSYIVNSLPYFTPDLQTDLIEVAANQGRNFPREVTRVQFNPGSKWQTPYDQPVLLRTAGWIYE